MLVRGVPLEALASLEGEPVQWLEEPSLFLLEPRAAADSAKCSSWAAKPCSVLALQPLL